MASECTSDCNIASSMRRTRFYGACGCSRVRHDLRHGGGWTLPYPVEVMRPCAFDATLDIIVISQDVAAVHGIHRAGGADSRRVVTPDGYAFVRRHGMWVPRIDMQIGPLEGCWPAMRPIVQWQRMLVIPTRLPVAVHLRRRNFGPPGMRDEIQTCATSAERIAGGHVSQFRVLLITTILFFSRLSVLCQRTAQLHPCHHTGVRFTFVSVNVGLCLPITL